MDSGISNASTPGPLDTSAPLTTPSANTDSPSDSSLDLMKDRHQSDNKPGGNNDNERVLWCNNLDSSFNYLRLVNLFKEFGIIERIKLKLTGKNIISAFITFVSNVSAKKAKEFIINQDNMNSSSFSIINSKNLIDEVTDYIPKLSTEDIPKESINREKCNPMWFVANYKDNYNNSLKGLQCLEEYIGKIPKENFKKYGKSLLIKAKNELQASLLLNLKPLQDSIITSVKPHNTFNLNRGVIFSKELYEFSAKEILEFCPPSVYDVKKLNGRNSAIILFFSSQFLPDYINVKHLQFRIRKFKLRPQQCYKCFEYGHVMEKCKSNTRCNKCSMEMSNAEHDCNNYHCFHCKGDHSPQSQVCPRFQFEREITEIAHNEHISYGRAKNKLMGANKSPDSTYAKVISQIKLTDVRVQTNLDSQQSNRPNASQHSVRPKEKSQEQTSVTQINHHNKNEEKPSTSDNSSKNRNNGNPLPSNHPSDKQPSDSEKSRDHPQSSNNEGFSTNNSTSTINSITTEVSVLPTTSSSTSSSTIKPSDGFWKLNQDPQLKLENKFSILATLEDDNNDNVTPDSKISTPKTINNIPTLESQTESKKRGLENRTPPKSKKPNINDDESPRQTDENKYNDEEMDTTNTKQHESENTEYPDISPDLNDSNMDCQSNLYTSATEKSIAGAEATSQEPPTKDIPQSEKESDKISTNEISPSPIIGNTSKFHQLPKPSQIRTDMISPSPILGKAGHKPLQPLRTKSTHALSCGCHDCFNFQLNSMKQCSVKTISNLVDNFIRYKAKNKYGKLEDHVEDCMCVDHLVKKHTPESQVIKRLIEKIKEKQKAPGATSKTPSLKPKPNQPLGTQPPSTTKISRNNVMTSSASNSTN